ncbi:MAG: hypothetical protein ACLQOZ_16050 [Acidimicrobiales bacterium]
MTIFLIVVGILGMWAYSFANSNVHNQLAEQQITFPTQAAFAAAKPGTEITPGMLPYLQQYAGEPLTTGAQAEAYADHFIAIHLQEIGGGKTYSQLSAESEAQPNNTKLAGEVATVFKGTTLRGLLLEAYAFWKMGQIAFYAALTCFIAAGVMLILTILGYLHLRKVPSTEEL